MLRPTRALPLAAALAIGAGSPALAAPGDATDDEAADVQPVADDGTTQAAEADKPLDEKKHKKHRHKKHRHRAAFETQLGSWQAGVDAHVGTSGGGLAGHGTLRENALFFGLGGEVEPQIERDRWRVRAPLSVEHRQTQGASLSESRIYLDGEVRYRRSARLRLTGEVRVGGVWRPNWPDQYQPMATGQLASTGRYSHWDRRIGFGVAGIPRRHHHVRARYRYTIVDYAEDPNYDPSTTPTHLVPGDHGQHDLDFSWRYLGKGWKVGAGLDIGIRNDYFAYARDASTGLTHAGAGGPPPNPLQQIVGVEPSIEGERTLAGGRLELGAAYGFEIVDDTYQGYYSYTGHHPQLDLSWKIRPHTTARVSGELWWRTYGANSYAAGGTHPPLLYGDRRVDHRGRARLRASTRLADHWTGTADGSVYLRRTNFPTYEPGIFPSTRDYDIDWNYDNWIFTIGAEYRM